MTKINVSLSFLCFKAMVDFGFLTKHFLPLNCDHIKRGNFSPCDWATSPALLGVCGGDNHCRLLLNLGVGRVGGGMFVFLLALVKSSHAVPLSLCQRVPYHFRWRWKTGMMKHHRCWRLSPFLCAQTERDRHRQKKHTHTHNANTHISAFPSHLTANALWVMLELELGTENLRMSLYTYMDDEDAFWVPLAMRGYVGQEREEQCEENSK